MQQPRRVALVHEWLTSMRGGERVLESLGAMFPGADLFTLLHIKGSVSGKIEAMPIRTSFIQHLPLASTRYRYYLPLFPTAIRRFDLREYDLVISSHHSVAKSVRTGPRTLHLCYCHTPMRYIWNLFDDYFGEGRSGAVTRAGARLFRGYLQRQDLASAGNPAAFVANSEHIRSRIRKIYNRDAEVIYPPVEVKSFSLATGSGEYYLVAGALVPYKRVDLAIRVFNGTGDPLVVAGDGPDRERLQSIAGPNISFQQDLSDQEMKTLFAGCRALIFPGEEDFGIIPVEAMASGKPVVAYGKGGALETVRDGETGILFAEQTEDSLSAAVRRLCETVFDPVLLREHAMRFDRSVFEDRMSAFVRRHWEEWVRTGLSREGGSFAQLPDSGFR
ncbi:MAG: glycosyltransferase [Ignavibacteria bacterium]|nr:glycosyltransferase [Ignavibacteria bacterium]